MLRSIRARVIALSIALVTITTVVTTLTVSATVESTLRSMAEQSLSEDAEIFRTLLDFGSTRSSWDGVEAVAKKLAQQHNRRIALKTPEGKPIVDTDRLLGTDSGPLRGGPDARIDPTDASMPFLGHPTAQLLTPRIISKERMGASMSETALAEIQACQDQLRVAYVVELAPDGTEVFDYPATSQFPPDAYLQDVATGTAYISADERNPSWDEVFTCTEDNIDIVPLPAIYAASEAVADSRAKDPERRPAIEKCLREAGYDLRTLDWYANIIVMNANAHTLVDYKTCREEYDRSTVASAADLYLGSDRTTTITKDVFTRGTTVPVVAAILLAAAVAAWLLASLSTRPLRRLAAAADAVAKGEYGQRISGRGRSEVNRVARSFDAMADRLQQNEAMRRQMVDDISHEMRNPLSTLMGTLEAVQDRLRPPSHEVMQSMLEETAHLASIVDDLSVLQGADARTLRLDAAAVDAGTLTRGVIDVAMGTATARSITIHTSVAADVVAFGDARRIRQIIANLVSNAVRYTPDGGTIEVTVSGTRRGVQVSVSDSGPGVAIEDREHVFERFWRADAARSRHTGGSGLGLAIARDLARAHGGDVVVSDSPLGGARFQLFLPRRPLHDLEETLRSTPFPPTSSGLP